MNLKSLKTQINQGLKIKIDFFLQSLYISELSFMAERIITKSFARLLDKGKHRGFITYEELGKSLGKRNN